jgi:hypothetical protein
MSTKDLISKLIDLQEQADTLLSKIQQMQATPKKEREASRHQKRFAKLNSNIQLIIRQIAATGPEKHSD